MKPVKLLAPPEPSLTFHKTEGLTTSLHCPNNGTLNGFLLSGSLHSTVYLWDLVILKRLVTKFQCDTKAEKNTTVLWTYPDARATEEVFVQLRDGSVHKWKVIETQPIFLRKTHLNLQHTFCPATAFEDQRLICIPAGEISSNSSGLLMISHDSLSHEGSLMTSANHGSPMRMVRFKDSQLLVAYEDTTVILWDIRSQTTPVFTSEIIRESCGSQECPTPLALDIDSATDICVVGTSGNVVHRFDIEPSRLKLRDGIEMAEDGVSDVRIRQDGKIITVASWDNTARVFSFKSRKPLAVLDMHRDTIQRIEYAKLNDENHVILGGKDSLISVWPLY